MIFQFIKEAESDGLLEENLKSRKVALFKIKVSWFSFLIEIFVILYIYIYIYIYIYHVRRLIYS